MTTKKPHQHAEAIKAWADGAAIECRSVTPGPPRSWSPVAMPAWLPQYDYRVAEPKPKPKVKLKFRLYLCKYPWAASRVWSHNADSAPGDAPERSTYFVRWLGDWQEIEIDAE